MWVGSVGFRAYWSCWFRLVFLFVELGLIYVCQTKHSVRSSVVPVLILSPVPSNILGTSRPTTSFWLKVSKAGKDSSIRQIKRRRGGRGL